MHGFLECSLQEDSWVTSLGRLLYWVPLDNRQGLREENVLTIPNNLSGRSTRLDFSRFRGGEAWTQVKQ
jgi:hypothetical protein